MSGRHLNRLRGAAKTAGSPPPSSSEAESSSDDDTGPVPTNPFALLIGSDEEEAAGGRSAHEEASDAESASSSGSGNSGTDSDERRPEPLESPTSESSSSDDGGAEGGAGDAGRPGEAAAGGGPPPRSAAGRAGRRPRPGANADGRGRGGGGRGKGRGGGGRARGPSSGATDEGDLDSILRELGHDDGQSSESGEEGDDGGEREGAGQRPSGDPWGLAQALTVDPSLLDAGAELRRRFGRGADAPEGGAADGGPGAGTGRRAGGGAGGRRGRASARRQGRMIAPRDHWAPFDGGVFQERVRGSGGEPTRHTLRLTASYAVAQQAYEECLGGYDHNAIPELLYRHPYLPDALLTTHEVHTSLGEADAAEDALERCVYGIEQAWRPGFLAEISGAGRAPPLGRCASGGRAARGSGRPGEASAPAATPPPYVPDDETNAAQFAALFRYARSLSRRGLPRAALEVAKLGFSLNGEDPAGFAYAIDYYALRAKAFAFVEELSVTLELDALPGLMFSRAMAAKGAEARLASGEGREAGGRPGGGAAGGAPAGTARPPAAPLELLTAAVMAHPAAVPRLLTKLNASGVRDHGWWTGVRVRAPFALCEPVEDDGLDKALDLFVERHHLLWKGGDALELLGLACREAVKPGARALGLDLDGWRLRVEARRRTRGGPSVPVGLSPEDPGRADGGAPRPPTPKNPGSLGTLERLRKSDFSDVVERLPAEEVQRVRQMAREWVPDDDDYDGGGDGGGGGGGDAHEALAEARRLAELHLRGELAAEDLPRGPLLRLLRTLLPWVDLIEGGEEDSDHEG